jgi:5'-3' exonuclease
MRLLLVDGFYYIYRSFFAIRELSNSRGEPTNAIYGFVKTIRKMLKDLKPDLAAVMWDEGLPVRRTKLQPEYKATRAEMPDTMRPQIGIIREIAPLLGIASVAAENTEADDLICTYTKAARARGIEVIIGTNDKDLFQLVDDGCFIYSTNKTDLASPDDPHALLGADKVRAKWGVVPGLIGDALALIGDSVDNIPGVDGLGPKTAATLLNEHGSLDAILANLEAVKSERTREKLRAAREQIASNREMVRLDDDLPLPVLLDEMRVTPRWTELIAALEHCEFKGLTAEVRKEAGVAAPAPAPTPPPPAATAKQGELF